MDGGHELVPHLLGRLPGVGAHLLCDAHESAAAFLRPKRRWRLDRDATCPDTTTSTKLQYFGISTAAIAGYYDQQVWHVAGQPPASNTTGMSGGRGKEITSLGPEAGTRTVGNDLPDLHPPVTAIRLVEEVACA